VAHEAARHVLVLSRPERWKGVAFQLLAVGGAKPRSGEPEDGAAARVALEDEGVGQKRLDVGWFDLDSPRRGAAAAQPVPILEQSQGSVLHHVCRSRFGILP